MLRCMSVSSADRLIRKKPGVTFTARPASGTPRVCSACFISTPGTFGMPPGNCASFGHVEHDLDGVARRQRLVGVAAERPGDAHLAIGNLDVGAHREAPADRPARAGLRSRCARSPCRRSACRSDRRDPPRRAPRAARLATAALAAALDPRAEALLDLGPRRRAASRAAPASVPGLEQRRLITPP